MKRWRNNGSCCTDSIEQPAHMLRLSPSRQGTGLRADRHQGEGCTADLRCSSGANKDAGSARLDVTCFETPHPLARSISEMSSLARASSATCVSSCTSQGSIESMTPPHIHSRPDDSQWE